MDQIDPAAMLAVKRSGDVIRDLNLNNQLHPGEEHTSEGSIQALKPTVDVTRRSKTGVLKVCLHLPFFSPFNAAPFNGPFFD